MIRWLLYYLLRWRTDWLPPFISGLDDVGYVPWPWVVAMCDKESFNVTLCFLHLLWVMSRSWRAAACGVDTDDHPQPAPVCPHKFEDAIVETSY